MFRSAINSLKQLNKNTLSYIFNDNHKFHVLNSKHLVNLKTSPKSEYNADRLTYTLMCHKYLRLIKNAVREGGPIVELNPRLSNAIEKAKKNGLPPDFIQFARKISCDCRAIVGLFDVVLPNGCHFLIQYEDVDSSITRHHLLKLCEEQDGTLIQGETIWPRAYEQKGFIFIQSEDSNPLSNTTNNALVKLGVESLHKETDVEGIAYWKLTCDAWILPDVKQEMLKITNKIEEAYVGFIPKKKIKVTSFHRRSITDMFIEFGKIPTIDLVYTNVNIDQ